MRKYRAAVHAAAEAEEEFAAIRETTIVRTHEQDWQQREAAAQDARRRGMENVDAMDIFDVTTDNGSQ